MRRGPTSTFLPQSGPSIDNMNDEPIFTNFPQPTHLKLLKSSNLIIWGTEKYGNPSIAGYNPRNGDFEIEYMNSAEEVMCLASNLYDYNVRDHKEGNKEEKKLLKELQCTLGEIYNSTLQERETRKNIAKEYGMLNLKGSRLWYSRLEVKTSSFLLYK